ncbi:hypothetical protein BD289DRAFT_360746 [Coniella lustricola]|uniref:Amidohydrolase-related domain-containing protein n=1 Tax=Coniella lustricola TaxID=2025994 RepID=A0A2T3AJ61_9PEZI|nr:hypothetical protein BD289DRAFT_360746 [Coniella lustricola]
MDIDNHQDSSDSNTDDDTDTDTDDEETPSDLYGVTADLLIPGRGDPIPNGGIIVSPSTGTIHWAGQLQSQSSPRSSLSLPEKYAHVPFTSHPGTTLLPGLWDVHTHFFGTGVAVPTVSGNSIAEWMPGHQARVGAALVADLHATLLAGFTSVRELGGTAGHLQPLIAAGAIAGPNVYSALAVLTITGGHGDRHDCPLEVIRPLDPNRRAAANDYMICDGVDECLRGTRQVIRNGAKVIKICSTGGVLSLQDSPEDSQFGAAEIEAIVQEAARSSRVVASHAIGKNGIVSALKGGVKTIEHGMYLDAEVAALMKEKGAILVPTRHIVETIAAGGEEFPPPLKKKVEKVIGRIAKLSRKSLQFAVAEGVKIALGTDTHSSDRSSPISHGKNAKELHWLKEAGMTPLQAIEAATATPPETLGGQAPKAGQLRAGYDADFILVRGNPLDDLEVLMDVDSITHVWKGAKAFKST